MSTSRKPINIHTSKHFTDRLFVPAMLYALWAAISLIDETNYRQSLNHATKWNARESEEAFVVSIMEPLNHTHRRYNRTQIFFTSWILGNEMLYNCGRSFTWEASPSILNCKLRGSLKQSHLVILSSNLFKVQTCCHQPHFEKYTF